MYCFLTVKMCVVPYDHSEPSISDITFQICASTPQLKAIVHNIIKRSSEFCSFTLFNVHEYFECLYICAPHKSLVPTDSRRGFGSLKLQLLWQ